MSRRQIDPYDAPSRPPGRLAEHARLSVSRSQRPLRRHEQYAVRRDEGDGEHGDVAKLELYCTECDAVSTTQKVPWTLHGAPSGSSSHERLVCKDNTQPCLVRHQDVQPPLPPLDTAGQLSRRPNATSRNHRQTGVTFAQYDNIEIFKSSPGVVLSGRRHPPAC